MGSGNWATYRWIDDPMEVWCGVVCTGGSVIGGGGGWVDGVV